MVVYMVILRLIHTLSGVFWAGWAFVLAGFIEPAVEASRPESDKFMQAMLQKTRIMQVMMVTPPLTALSGVLLYWQVSGGLNVRWITSTTGLGLTIGSVAGIAALVYGLAVNRPAGARMHALSVEMQAAGGPPAPEQLAEMEALQEKMSRAGSVAAILLVICLIGMSLA